MAIINCPTCSQDDFEHAVYVDASPGDTIVLPSGSATWGNSSRANNGTVYITLANLLVVGQGDETIITLDDSGSTYAGGVIALWAAATFSKVKIVGSNSRPVTAFNIGPYSTFTGGFRLTDITYVGGTADAYFAYIGEGVLNGLIDNNRITGNSGAAELIFGRGPSDAWTTDDTLGGSNNIFIEDNTFGGQGYLCDANANARFVVRFNTINASNKIDGHGVASNTPVRSCRHLEIYGNAFTATSGFNRCIELRGGTARVFDNTAAGADSDGFYLTEYGCLSQWPNFGNTYQDPSDYPVAGQIGVGKDPKSGGSAPVYIINNLRGGEDWGLTWETIPAGAITHYGSSFTMQDLIASDRDYFKQVASFDGSTGCGRGTKSQMLAITPTKTGVGYWVTDEGSWDTTKAANTSGQLYVWDGADWVLDYTPYTYPHPLAGESVIYRPKRVGRRLKFRAYTTH